MLRRLRESVKLSRQQPAWDEKIARPFRRALGEDRRFDFDKTLLVEIIAGRFRHAVTNAQIARQLWAAQVEITVGQAQVFVTDLPVKREGENLRAVQDRQARGQNFDLARGELGIFRSRQTRGDATFHLDDVFILQVMRSLRHLGILLRTEDDLGQAFAIAQVDKNDATVVAPGMDPAGQFDLLADIGGAKSVAVMGAIHGGSGGVSVWAKGGIAQVRSRSTPEANCEVPGRASPAQDDNAC